MPVLAAVQQELRQLDVLVAFALAFHPADEPAKANQTDLHGLMSVVPGLLGRRADIVAPTIGESLGRVVQPVVGPVGEQVVRNGRFEEIAGHVTLVIVAVLGRPMFAVAERKDGLQISVGFLGGQDLGNPVLQGRFHRLLGLDNLPVALGIDHQRNADRLDRVVDPGVGEHVAAVVPVRFSSQLVGSVDEVVDAALRQVRVGDLVDTMRDPIDDQGLRRAVPEWIVDPVFFGVDRIEVGCRRRRNYLDRQGGRGTRGTFAGRQFQGVVTHGRKSRRGGRGRSVGESDHTGTGCLVPGHGGRGALVAQGFQLSSQIGLPALDDHAIDTCGDRGGKVGRVARVVDFPLDDASGKAAVAVDLQP